MKTEKQTAGNSKPDPKRRFEECIEKGIIDSIDGYEALQYVQEEKHLRNWKEGSIARQYQALKPFLIHLKQKNLKISSLNKKATLDIIDFLKTGTDWSEDTKPSNWDRFSRFWRWAYKKHGKTWDADAKQILIGDDTERRWVYKRDHNKIIKKDIFTVDEMKLLVSAESEPCYKAFFGATFEGGMRCGETLSLRLEDVKRTDYGYDLAIRISKTEKRTVWVEKYFVHELAKWLELHPDKANKESPLFFNKASGVLESKAANKRLKQVAKKLFPERKKVSIHSLRHSWATHVASFMNEAQMKNYFGWNDKSDMPSVYIRLKQVDVRHSMRRAHGIEKEEHKEEGRVCLECQHINPSRFEYCDICKMPLDPKELVHKKELNDVHGLVEKLILQTRGTLIKEMQDWVKGDKK